IIPCDVTKQPGGVDGAEVPVALQVRYRGQKIDVPAKVKIDLTPYLTVYQHPPAKQGRIGLQVDPKLLRGLAWEKLQLTIVFDRSASMEDPDEDPEKKGRTRLPVALRALRTMLTDLPNGPKVTLWTFGHNNAKNPKAPEQLANIRDWSTDKYLEKVM